jgi:hypothetical protein
MLTTKIDQKKKVLEYSIQNKSTDSIIFLPALQNYQFQSPYIEQIDTNEFRMTLLPGVLLSIYSGSFEKWRIRPAYRRIPHHMLDPIIYKRSYIYRKKDKSRVLNKCLKGLQKLAPEDFLMGMVYLPKAYFMANKYDCLSNVCLIDSISRSKKKYPLHVRVYYYMFLNDSLARIVHQKSKGAIFKGLVQSANDAVFMVN